MEDCFGCDAEDSVEHVLSKAPVVLDAYSSTWGHPLLAHLRIEEGVKCHSFLRLIVEIKTAKTRADP